MKIAFLFPGQGSQYGGMFQAHRQRYTIARETFREASDVLGFDVARLCAEGDEELLARPENAQPALVAAGVAAYRVWRDATGITPVAMAGHSLGEYTALVCSGALPYGEALYVVRQRGLLMRQAASRGGGGMLAAGGIGAEEAEQAVSSLRQFAGQLAVACYNSASQQVFAGSEAALAAVERLLAPSGARMVSLKVGAAFHSPWMADAARGLEGVLRERISAFSAPRLPVISNVTAKPHQAAAEHIVRTLVRQMTEPVRWRQSMAYLSGMLPDMIIDAGPQRTLKNLLLQDDPTAAVHAFDSPSEHGRLFGTHSPNELGPRLPESRYDTAPGAVDLRREADSNSRLLQKCLAAAVAAPNRNDEPAAYERGAIEPYRQLERLLREAEERNREPSDEEVRRGLLLLDQILATKGADGRAWKERVDEIRVAINGREGLSC